MFLAGVVGRVSRLKLRLSCETDLRFCDGFSSDVIFVVGGIFVDELISWKR